MAQAVPLFLFLSPETERGKSKDVIHSKVKSPSRDELANLVQTVGGPEPLLEILWAFYRRMEKDLLIGFFFEGHDLEKIVHAQRQFILMAAGLVDRFEGKGPSTAHVAIAPILQGHFDRRLILLRETLGQLNLPEVAVDQWVRFEESFRRVIVSEETQKKRGR